MKEHMKTGLLLSILVSVSLAGMLVLAVNRISDLENQLADTREERAIRKSEAGAAGPRWLIFIQKPVSKLDYHC